MGWKSDVGGQEYCVPLFNGMPIMLNIESSEILHTQTNVTVFIMFHCRMMKAASSVIPTLICGAYLFTGAFIRTCLPSSPPGFHVHQCTAPRSRTGEESLASRHPAGQTYNSVILHKTLTKSERKPSNPQLYLLS